MDDVINILLGDLHPDQVEEYREKMGKVISGKATTEEVMEMSSIVSEASKFKIQSQLGVKQILN